MCGSTSQRPTLTFPGYRLQRLLGLHDGLHLTRAGCEDHGHDPHLAGPQVTSREAPGGAPGRRRRPRRPSSSPNRIAVCSRESARRRPGRAPVATGRRSSRSSRPPSPRRGGPRTERLRDRASPRPCSRRLTTPAAVRGAVKTQPDEEVAARAECARDPITAHRSGPAGGAPSHRRRSRAPSTRSR